MKASYAELKGEIHEMKERISDLEKAYDAIATRDDLLAIEQAHKDLKEGPYPSPGLRTPVEV